MIFSKRVWRWGAALSVLFFVFLLASAPARLLAYLLPSDQVLAQGYSGSLWSGSADSVAVAVPGGYLQLGLVNWELSPWSLLLFSPRMQLQTRWGSQHLDGHITLYPGGDIDLRDTEISLDASVIKQWLPIQVDGQLNALVQELSIEDGQLAAGEGRLVWQRARWLGSRGPQPLGDYVAEFEIPESEQLGAKISTLSGPIEINGQASLFGRALTLDARLTSDEPVDPELAQPLQLVATPIDEGFHLKMTLDL
jgi:hypothetical protein